MHEGQGEKRPFPVSVQQLFIIIFFFTKKQPDDLLMIHLLLLFMPKGVSRLVEMKASAKQATQIFVCMCCCAGRGFVMF